MKKLILGCVGLMSLSVFGGTAKIFENGMITREDKKLIKRMEESKNYSCKVSENLKKVEGKTYIGHYDENGKPAGEWKLKDGSVRQCFLKDGEITEVKGNYFKKISKNMDLLISYGNYGQRPDIDVYNVFVKKNGERTDNYLYLERYNGKYSKKLGRLLLLDEIKPLYEQERVLKDDASIPLEIIKK